VPRKKRGRGLTVPEKKEGEGSPSNLPLGGKFKGKKKGGESAPANSSVPFEEGGLEKSNSTPFTRRKEGKIREGKKAFLAPCLRIKKKKRKGITSHAF